MQIIELIDLLRFDKSDFTVGATFQFLLKGTHSGIISVADDPLTFFEASLAYRLHRHPGFRCNEYCFDRSRHGLAPPHVQANLRQVSGAAGAKAMLVTPSFQYDVRVITQPLSLLGGIGNLESPDFLYLRECFVYIEPAM